MNVAFRKKRYEIINILKHSVLYTMVLISFFSCKTSSKTSSTKTTYETILEGVKNQNQHDMGTLFLRGFSSEPIWNINFTENQVVFTSLVKGFEKVVFPYQDPNLVLDANIKNYQLQNEAFQLGATVSKKECMNSLSGEQNDYEITIIIKKANDSSALNFNGCGNYITDQRLQQRWILENMNGKKVTLSDFSGVLPYIEINAKEKKFSGFAGCNRILGNLFCEYKILQFKDIITTKIYCENNKETYFINMLKEVHQYKIDNNQLLLNLSNGEQMVFKKGA